MKKTKESIFKYSTEIDKKLPLVIKKVLGIKVKRVQRIAQGIMNYSFKIETEKDLVLARIFGKKDVVDIAKLLWINKQLEKNQIKHPKIMGYSVTDEFFPYGFMLTEYVSGKDGIRAINEKNISLPDYFHKLGKLVKKIHTIPVNKYGEINEIDNGRNNYSEDTISKVDSLAVECVNAGNLSSELSDKIKEKVKKILLKYESRFTPVLVHGDCGPSNQILSVKNDLFMIDWDYARKGVWLEDLVPVVLSADNFSKINQRKGVVSKIRKSFLKGYGETKFSEKEIIEIEQVFTIIAFLYNLTFYSADQRNVDAVTSAKEKIIELITS